MGAPVTFECRFHRLEALSKGHVAIVCVYLCRIHTVRDAHKRTVLRYMLNASFSGGHTPQY